MISSLRRAVAVCLLAGTLNSAGDFIDPHFRWLKRFDCPKCARGKRQLTILRDLDQRYNTLGRSDSVISDPRGFTFNIVSASSIICP